MRTKKVHVSKARREQTGNESAVGVGDIALRVQDTAHAAHRDKRNGGSYEVQIQEGDEGLHQLARVLTPVEVQRSRRLGEDGKSNCLHVKYL